MKYSDSRGQSISADVITSNIVGRLAKLVKSRYQCQLSFINSAEVNRLLHPEFVRRLEQSKRPLIRKGQLHIPILVKDVFKGVAQVKDIQNLNKEKANSLREVVSMVLESTLMTASSLELLNRLEEQRQAATNVIDLHQFKQGLKVAPFAINKDYESKGRFNLPCLIESQISSDILKMAIEVHEHSRRFAFVQFDQLDDYVRHDHQQLLDLGHVSIFIKDIESLSEKERQCLIDFFESPRDGNSPQIIAGTNSSLNEIMDDPSFPQQLLMNLRAAHLRMQRPFKEYSAKGIVQFFYDSLVHPVHLT